jgi:ATP-dependent Clp protease protease subunit
MNEIFIYDEIGPDYWGLVGANYIRDELAKYKGNDVTVRINSPGGSVTEGQAIYNFLLRHDGDVTIEIDSLAASMGSYIAMAGKTIRIAENAMVMVHNPWSIAIGDAAEMRKSADVLEKFQLSASEVYARRSGQKLDKIRELMDAESWLTAAEAIELGFADEISQPLNSMSARIVPQDRFAKTPDRFLATAPPPKAQERIEQRNRKIEQLDRELKLSRSRLGV